MDAKLLLLRFLLTNFKTITPIATTVHFPFHRNQTFVPFPSFHARHSNACQPQPEQPLDNSHLPRQYNDYNSNARLPNNNQPTNQNTKTQQQ
jgi:hypothetical protein